jgi:hypothetical protein
MATELIEYLKSRKPKGFKSCPFYSREGDFLTFFFQDDDYYAERIDEILTVFRSHKTKKFVGFKLKGVAHLLTMLGTVRVRVVDDEGNLRLFMLLLAGSMRTREPYALPYYQRFVKRTIDVPIRREELQPV